MMFDSNRSSDVNYYAPPPKLLYTPKPQECMGDCAYEKTVSFLLSDKAGG